MAKSTITRKAFLVKIAAILGLAALGPVFFTEKKTPEKEPSACDHCGHCTARFCRYFKE